jgi:hypothetical protein
METGFRVPIPVLYGIENWGNGYFDVNAAGHLMVKPFRSGPGIDLYQVVEDLAKRRCPAPVVLRFPQILETQVRILHQAFQSAITEFQYGAPYKGGFPMKVNHRRDVIEELLRVGSRYDFGLEVGSKAELYVALSIHQTEESLLICNGFKTTPSLKWRSGGWAGSGSLSSSSRSADQQHPEDDRGDWTHPILGLRAPLHARKREVGGVRGRELEVRPADGRDDRVRADPAGARPRGLPEDAALPHRIADHGHPQDQGGREGSEPRLREDRKIKTSSI